jgi:hypothetical protein
MSALAENPKTLSSAQRSALLARIPSTVQRTVSNVTLTAERAVWASFAEWATSNARTDDAWSRRYVATVAAAQTDVYGVSASLYADYVALASVKAADTPRLSRDVLVSAADDYTFSPPKRMGKLLSEGAPFAAAVDAAGLYAAALSSLDVNASAQRALVDVSRDNPNRLRGQRKALSGGACGWCQVVADQLYGLNVRVPSHEHDRCVPQPVVEGDGFESGQLSGGKWEELMSQRAVPTPRVEESTRIAAIERAAA